MAALSDLRSRIDDDLARTDLSSQRNRAIADAVRRYESERFHFNEFWRVTATLSSGAMSIPFSQIGITPTAISRVALQRTSTYWEPLAQTGGDEIENLKDVVVSTSPSYWAMQGDAIVFDCSVNANYAVVIDGVKRIASASASASDNDSAAWYNEAEPLIRAAAKKSLYLHVIKDDDEAARAATAEAEALKELRDKTVRKRTTGKIRPMRF